jgi:endoglucanase
MEFFAKNGRIYLNDTPISIRGINWFGCEIDGCVHGLWMQSLDKFIDTLVKNKFNALRVTMSAETMLNMDTIKVKYVNGSLNPGMDQMTAGQVFDILMEKCSNAGILVMPNMHRLKNGDEIPAVWYSSEYPEEKVIDAWQTLVKRYVKYTNFFGVDLKNEPHSPASWGDNNKGTDWAAASERIGNAILKVNKKLLIFVAGITSQIWGDDVSKCLTRPVNLEIKNKVVYTPHFYIHWNYPSKEGFNITKYLDSCVGNVVRDKKSSVVIGEWGYDHSSSLDTQWTNEFVSYMTSLGLTDAFYWAFNNNSGLNHSILLPDWETPIKEKMDLVSKLTPNPTKFNFKDAPTPPKPTPTPPKPTPTPPKPTPTPPKPTPTPPKPTPTPPKPTPSPSTGNKIDIQVKQTNAWTSNNTNYYQQEVTLINNTNSPIKNVKLQIADTTIVNIWNVAQKGAFYELPEWLVNNGGLNPKQTFGFGYITSGNPGKISSV